MNRPPDRVAVVGAGVAGSACARFLADAGIEVQLFDKSRGVGGRLSTRRAEWTASNGSKHSVRFDHGAPAFSAHTPEFVRCLEQAASAGLLSRWLPQLAPGSCAPPDQLALWLPTPDMPTWCRAMVAGLPVVTGCAVDALQRSLGGWRLESAGSTVSDGFDAVVVAIPPQQAALLLQPHQAEWAQRAAAIPMLPCWVLMGVTDHADCLPEWDLAWPNASSLAWVVRNDAKPGRERTPGLAHWVIHATALWSQKHLESPAADVQSELQAMLASWLGRSLTWHHAAVHRWRYATVSPLGYADTAAGTAERCCWDARSSLGVCGDALGGAGVEGAWASACALADRIIGHKSGSLAQSLLPDSVPLAQP